MTKLITLLFSVNIIVAGAIAQNTFPVNGNVGIGTVAPIEKLSVITPTATSGITHSDGTIKVGTFVGSGAGYYGTISNHPLYFRTNNGAAQVALLQNGRFGIGTTTPVGRLDVTGGDAYIQNVRFGLGNGNIITNTCVGRIAISANTTGSNNTGIGYGALSTNTTGSFNTANGVGANRYNTTGSQNTATGYSALSRNTTGNYNVAIGSNSLRSNIGGYSNVAMGVAALANNTVHSNLIAIGDSALYNAEAGFNLAIGSKALLNTTKGVRNTAVGHNSLYGNTEGGYNTAFGFRSLFSNTLGTSNVAIGDLALATNTVGSFNTALGSRALFNNGYGNYNTVIGYNADVHGFPTKGGMDSYSNSTAIGADTYCEGDYATALGSGAYSGANSVMIGSASITSIGGFVDFTNISDGRVKKNIRQNVPGLTFINKLTPVTYNLDLDAVDKITQVHPAKSKDGKLEKFRALKQAILYTGFVAQDVEKVAKESNYDFSGVDAAKNERNLYGLRYAEFVVPLVQSVQELSKKNEELQAQVNELKMLIEGINKKLAENETTSMQNVNISSASIQQNLPNPFNKSTTINYTLPQSKVAATILITDKGGKAVKELNVSGSGKGTVNINAGALSTGTYQYSLYVNGQLVDTKQMILSR